MFFDSVALSKRSWHYKLQKWTFGEVPYTTNFCPYFWLTIFCLLVFPLVAFFRGGKWLLVNAAGCLLAPFVGLWWLLEKTVDLIVEKVCVPYNHRQTVIYATKHMSDEEAYLLADYLYGDRLFPWRQGETDEFFRFMQRMEDDNIFVDYDDRSKRQFKINLARWKAWKENVGDSWKERLFEVREKYKQKELARLEWQEEQHKLQAAEKEKLKELAARRKKMFAKLVQYTKYFVLLPVGVAAIYLTYWLSLFILIIVENWDDISHVLNVMGQGIWYALINWGPWVLGVLLGLVFVVALIVNSITLIKRCVMNITMPKPIKQVSNKIGQVVNPVIEFFTMYVKTFKEDNCPSIDWKD